MQVWTALLSFAALALAACSAPPAAGPPIWRITDADSEIWLFGTVHVLPADLDWQSDAVESALASAQTLVTEANVSDATATAALTARYGLLPEGSALSDLLSQDRRAQLARVAASVSADGAELDRMRPWLASLRLSYLHAVAHGQASSAGVESVLLRQAQQRGLELAYLETSEQQIRTLADLPDQDQMLLLNSTLDEIEAGSTVLQDTQAAWAAGDVSLLEHLLDTQMRAAGPAVHDVVIARRNQVWAREIARRLSGSGRTFYAVGAAHLLGEDSVVAQLRRDGLRVEGP